MKGRVSGNLPRVSSVVPVWNEARYIESCITRLLEQTYPAHRLEILVVDGLSEERTREIVSQLVAAIGARALPDGGTPARIRLIDVPRRHRSSALNIGIRKAHACTSGGPSDSLGGSASGTGRGSGGGNPGVVSRKTRRIVPAPISLIKSGKSVPEFIDCVPALKKSFTANEVVMAESNRGYRAKIEYYLAHE